MALVWKEQPVYWIQMTGSSSQSVKAPRMGYGLVSWDTNSFLAKDQGPGGSWNMKCNCFLAKFTWNLGKFATSLATEICILTYCMAIQNIFHKNISIENEEWKVKESR